MWSHPARDGEEDRVLRARSSRPSSVESFEPARVTGREVERGIDVESTTNRTPSAWLHGSTRKLPGIVVPLGAPEGESTVQQSGGLIQSDCVGRAGIAPSFNIRSTHRAASR
jgi:hypothetical protein